MATPTRNGEDVGHIERDIAQVRHEVGRTVQEIGSRLTPAHLMEQAKRSLKDTTVDTTRAVAQQATDVAVTVASRTRDVAMDTRDRVQAHPYAAGAVGAGVAVGYWLVALSRRNRRRLVPREWDEPFDRSSRRSAVRTGYQSSGRSGYQMAPVAAAAIAAFLLWRTRM
jgi:ElaB/YqjD/DUF883 family membrane-anchored ribosome-binding protein